MEGIEPLFKDKEIIPQTVQKISNTEQFDQIIE